MNDSAAHPEIAAAVERLLGGGVVAFPTETVYGLGADAFSAAAVRRVFELKGRPANNPLIVHVADQDMARSAAGEWSSQSATLADRFWPGPLTIIAPRGPRIPDLVTAGGPTVGLRCPDHPLALDLIRAFGGPLVGPSANASGRISPTTAAHVRESFGREVLVLDGGPCRAGIESTVVALSPRPRVLRRGMISADAIARALGRPVEEAPAPGDPGAALESPGQLPQHYAPVTPARFFDPSRWAPAVGGERVVLLTHSGLTPHGLTVIRMPSDAEGYAARLYAALREADALRPAFILIERVPAKEPLWQAIADRLRRATHPA